MGLGNGNSKSGDKGSNWRYEYQVLKALSEIAANTSLVSPDYELRTTSYKAIANGPGYSIGDIIERVDIIIAATGVILSTLWFNATTGSSIAAPVIGNITPYNPPSSITVTNPFNLEATQQLVSTYLGSTTAAAVSTDADGSINAHIRGLIVLLSQTLPSSTTTGAWTNVDSTALEASHILKNSAGRVRSINGYNNKATSQYILVFDSATLPADTTAPLMIIAVNGLANFNIDFGELGRTFTNGVVVCNSSTANTKTIGSTDCWFNSMLK